MNLVRYAVEGRTDIPVAEKIIRFVGFEPLSDYSVVARGKSALDKRIPRIFRSGRQLNWLIMRDLDHDAPCAPDLVSNLTKNAHITQRVSLRIPVREVESWLLADKEGFSAEFSVRLSSLTDYPDNLDNPVAFLVDACKRSRSRKIQKAMVPLSGYKNWKGEEYFIRIEEFVRKTWKIERAAARSPSLKRTLIRLQALIDEGIWH